MFIQLSPHQETRTALCYLLNVTAGRWLESKPDPWNACYRWKERYFVLTTDYLQCFKKGTSRISEMGPFLYKVTFFNSS
jgi:hypothetical protein